MKFKFHLAIGLITPLILYYLLNIDLIPSLTIGAASVLIDFDHYLWYATETKNFNPFKAIKYHIRTFPIFNNMSLKKRNEYGRGVFEV